MKKVKLLIGLIAVILLSIYNLQSTVLNNNDGLNLFSLMNKAHADCESPVESKKGDPRTMDCETPNGVAHLGCCDFDDAYPLSCRGRECL